jgi:hypothetical protein
MRDLKSKLDARIRCSIHDAPQGFDASSLLFTSLIDHEPAAGDIEMRGSTLGGRGVRSCRRRWRYRDARVDAGWEGCEVVPPPPAISRCAGRRWVGGLNTTEDK